MMIMILISIFIAVCDNDFGINNVKTMLMNDGMNNDDNNDDDNLESTMVGGGGDHTTIGSACQHL